VQGHGKVSNIGCALTWWDLEYWVNKTTDLLKFNFSIY